MSTRIDGFEFVVLSGFFPYLNGLNQYLAVTVGTPAAALVQCEGRGNQLGSILREPLCPVESVGGLLTAGERQLDRAFRVIADLLEAHQGIDPGGVHRLHVRRSAGVKVV